MNYRNHQRPEHRPQFHLDAFYFSKIICENCSSKHLSITFVVNITHCPIQYTMYYWKWCHVWFSTVNVMNYRHCQSKYCQFNHRCKMLGYGKYTVKYSLFIYSTCDICTDVNEHSGFYSVLYSIKLSERCLKWQYFLHDVPRTDKDILQVWIF